MVGEKLVRAARRCDDEDIMGSGLHHVGDTTKATPCLVEGLKTNELVEKVLARRWRAGVGPRDADGSTPQRHPLLGGRDSLKAEQGLTSVEPDSKEPTRLWLVTNVDVLQRGEMLRVIREQTQLELALEAVNANQRP